MNEQTLENRDLIELLQDIFEKLDLTKSKIENNLQLNTLWREAQELTGMLSRSIGKQSHNARGFSQLLTRTLQRLERELERDPNLLEDNELNPLLSAIHNWLEGSQNFLGRRFEESEFEFEFPRRNNFSREWGFQEEPRSLRNFFQEQNRLEFFDRLSREEDRNNRDLRDDEWRLRSRREEGRWERNRREEERKELELRWQERRERNRREEERLESNRRELLRLENERREFDLLERNRREEEREARNLREENRFERDRREEEFLFNERREEEILERRFRREERLERLFRLQEFFNRLERRQDLFENLLEGYRFLNEEQRRPEERLSRRRREDRPLEEEITQHKSRRHRKEREGSLESQLAQI